MKGLAPTRDEIIPLLRLGLGLDDARAAWVHVRDAVLDAAAKECKATPVPQVRSSQGWAEDDGQGALERAAARILSLKGDAGSC